MEKHLYIVTDSKENIVEASALVASKPHAEVHFLIDKNDLEVTKLVHGLSKVHTIDMDKIRKLQSSQLFTPSHFINLFFDELKQVKEVSWDSITNYSSDVLSSYLTSYIEQGQVIGNWISQSGTINSSNSWAVMRNFRDEQCINPLNKNNWFHHIANTQESKEKERIKLTPQFNETASASFSKLKELFIEKDDHKFIGIALDNNTCRYIQAENIIKDLMASKNYIPVIINNGTNKHENFVNRITKIIDKRIVSINCTNTTLPNVLVHLHFLLSESTLTTTIASHLEIPTIEITSKDPLKSNFISNNPNSYVVFEKDIQWSEKVVNLIDDNISQTDLPSPIYKVFRDEYGLNIESLNNNSLEVMADYQLRRYFLMRTLGYNKATSLSEKLFSEMPNDYMETVKSEFTQDATFLVKNILSALRHVKNMKSDESVKAFIKNIDTIINLKSESTLLHDSIALFEGEIEMINEKDQEKTFYSFEKALFVLKNRIQETKDIIGELSPTNNDSVESKI